MQVPELQPPPFKQVTESQGSFWQPEKAQAVTNKKKKNNFFIKCKILFVKKVFKGGNYFSNSLIIFSLSAKFLFSNSMVLFKRSISFI